jgi:hypothetical protein
MGITSGRVFLRLTVALLIFQVATFTPAPAAQTHSATVDAHPIGVSVATIVEFGDQYLGGDELYDAKITVLEVVRGAKAWDIIRKASASNLEPNPGFEYVLGRVRFEFSARTSPSHYNYNLNESQFAATAADGREFAAPSLVSPPKPSLDGTLKPSDSLEGWLVFVVPRNVSKPLMVFREDVGTVSHRGGGTWFQLYARPAAASRAKP